MSQDLMISQSPETLKLTQKDLDQRLLSTALTAKERQSYTMALALTEKQLKNFPRAAALFSNVEANSVLYPSAQFFLAQIKYETGLESLAKQNTTVSLAQCAESRRTLLSLASLPEEPFYSQVEQSLLIVDECLVDSYIQSAQFALAKPILQKLLDRESMKEAKRSDLALKLARVNAKLGDSASLVFLSRKYALSFDGEPELLAMLRLGAGEKPKSQSNYKGNIPFSSLWAHPADKLFASAQSIQDFDQLLIQYPQTDAALKATSKIDILLHELSEKSITKEQLESYKKLSPDSLYKLGKELWDQEKSNEAFDIYRSFYIKYPFDVRASNALFFSARLFEDQKKWKEAREIFREVTLKYPNSTYAERSLFKLGFMSYLAKDDAQAVIWLEQYRAKVKHAHQQAEALYWLMKVSARQGKKQEEENYKKEILRIAPLSYYAFLTQQYPKILDSQTLYPTKISQEELDLIEKMLSFLQAGLPSFAKKYMDQLDLESQPELASLFAKLYFDTKNFSKSFSLVFDQLNQNSNAWNRADVMLFFPQEFSDEIKMLSKSQSLDPCLIQSLIKQESAYNSVATSRVGALGLMQLMPATALAVSKDSKIEIPKNLQVTDVGLNLQLGTAYFAGLLKEFNQKVPLALAAYNSGPKRTAAWQQRWKDLPMEELIELIPLDETRNYVKYILRNYAYYKLLQGETLLPEKILIQ